jgi:hypothetical protein
MEPSLLASFELKIISKDDRGKWQDSVRLDINKHLDPGKHAKHLVGAERYNCLFVITEKEEEEDIRSVLVKECFVGLLSDPVFFMSRKSIELNRLGTTNPNAHKWKYLRVVVFRGTFVGTASGNEG